MAWEREASASSLGRAWCGCAIGVALARHGGVLARMVPPFRMGAGNSWSGNFRRLLQAG